MTTMRDASSAYWFHVGDVVRVVDNVEKAGNNLKGRVGTVMETWEKCDVDPTCCCAEQVDVGMAVRVKFQGTEVVSTETETETEDETDSSFMYYFAEEELIKVNEDETMEETGQTYDQLPFGGMGCKAFKLEKLQMGQQAKRIAAYEQSQREENDPTVP